MPASLAPTPACSETLLDRLRDSQDALLQAFAALERALADGAPAEPLMRHCRQAQASHLLAGDALTDVMQLAHDRQLQARAEGAGRASLFVRSRG